MEIKNKIEDCLDDSNGIILSMADAVKYIHRDINHYKKFYISSAKDIIENMEWLITELEKY